MEHLEQSRKNGTFGTNLEQLLEQYKILNINNI